MSLGQAIMVTLLIVACSEDESFQGEQQTIEEGTQESESVDLQEDQSLQVEESADVEKDDIVAVSEFKSGTLAVFPTDAVFRGCDKQIKFRATYTSGEGELIDVSDKVTWSLTDPTLGFFDGAELTSMAPGSGDVVAKFKEDNGEEISASKSFLVKSSAADLYNPQLSPVDNQTASVGSPGKAVYDMEIKGLDKDTMVNAAEFKIHSVDFLNSSFDTSEPPRLISEECTYAQTIRWSYDFRFVPEVSLYEGQMLDLVLSQADGTQQSLAFSIFLVLYQANQNPNLPTAFFSGTDGHPQADHSY